MNHEYGNMKLSGGWISINFNLCVCNHAVLFFWRQYLYFITSWMARLLKSYHLFNRIKQGPLKIKDSTHQKDYQERYMEPHKTNWDLALVYILSSFVINPIHTFVTKYTACHISSPSILVLTTKISWCSLAYVYFGWWPT